MENKQRNSLIMKLTKENIEVHNIDKPMWKIQKYFNETKDALKASLEGINYRTTYLFTFCNNLIILFQNLWRKKLSLPWNITIYLKNCFKAQVQQIISYASEYVCNFVFQATHIPTHHHNHQSNPSIHYLQPYSHHQRNPTLLFLAHCPLI